LGIDRIETLLSLKRFNPANPKISKILILTVQAVQRLGANDYSPLRSFASCVPRYGRSGMGRLVWFSSIWSVSHSLAKL